MEMWLGVGEKERGRPYFTSDKKYYVKFLK